MSDTGADEGQGQWAFDWSQFPALWRVMESNGDADTHLAMLGVDVYALGQGGWTFDWDQFPALSLVMQSNGDADTHLAMLGVDTNALSETA